MQLPYLELVELVTSYRILLAAAAKAGLTLKDPETHEAWVFFRKLLLEKRRQEVQMLYQPHLFN